LTPGVIIPPKELPGLVVLIRVSSIGWEIRSPSWAGKSQANEPAGVPVPGKCTQVEVARPINFAE
jgi:hypothetical protein